MLHDESLTFYPEIPAMRRAARQLMMGQVTRVTVVLKERFWDNKVSDLSFVHSPERPFVIEAEAALYQALSQNRQVVVFRHDAGVTDAAKLLIDHDAKHRVDLWGLERLAFHETVPVGVATEKVGREQLGHAASGTAPADNVERSAHVFRVRLLTWHRRVR